MPGRISIAVLFSFLAALQVAGQAPPADLPWAHDVESAFKQATAEKKPVLFVIMKDKEIGCSRMLENVYTNEEVRARLKNFILLPCSTYDHAEPGSETCRQFPGVTCAEHQAIEREMRKRFQDENIVVAPQHLVCDATGRLVLRKLWEMKTAGMIEFLDRGHALFVEGATGASSEPAADSRPAKEPAADAAKPSDKLAPELEAKVRAILKADDAGKESLTKELMTEPTPERRRAFVELVSRLNSSKDKEIVIRALGYTEFAGAAPAVIEILSEKDTLARNCAVVTLEEMTNPEACDPLVQLHKKEKNPEVRKDIVRALGPCGAGKPEARAILLKELSSSQENVRSAAALSLGFFITGDAEVEKAIEKRWEKEGNNLRVKTAILWGIGQSGDGSFVALVEKLTKDEKNGQIKDVATAVKARLEGGDPWTALGGGGGGGMKSGRGGGRGRLMRILAPLYADDKIVRNRIKEFRNFRGN